MDVHDVVNDYMQLKVDVRFLMPILLFLSRSAGLIKTAIPTLVDAPNPPQLVTPKRPLPKRRKPVQKPCGMCI